MTMTAIFIFAGALLINSGSPGPSIAALVSRVLQKGWRSVIPFLMAMWIGEALWLTAAIFGLAALAVSFHLAFLVLKYLGVAYLIYLAYEMWNAPSDPDKQALPSSEDNWKMFGTGMALTLGNPKIMVFYIALLPSLIDISAIGFSDWSLLVLIMISVLAFTDLAWVLFANTARRVLKSPSAIRATNKISAGMMTGAACFLALRE